MSIYIKHLHINPPTLDWTLDYVTGPSPNKFKFLKFNKLVKILKS